MKMKTITDIAPVRIKADFGYFKGTYNAPKDGYLMSEPEYNGRTGREITSPLEFASVDEAYNYLTESGDNYNAMHCGYDGDGEFSRRGVYVTSHGQHSRPVYKIVSAKSGRCNEAIKAACDEKMNES